MIIVCSGAMKKFNDYLWHDGKLHSVEFISALKEKLGSVIIHVTLYENEVTRDTIQVRIAFKDVTNFIVTCDVSKLQENLFAGNIGNAYLHYNDKKSKQLDLVVCRFFLVDGYIEIFCKNIEIS